jgi:cysteine desulfurase
VNARRLYLDWNAGAPPAPGVRAVMEPWLGHQGNPSSVHAEGRAARHAIDDARDRVAAVLGTAPHAIVFTGGGTEANNLGVLGLARAAAAGRRHALVSAVEHHAVLRAVESLGGAGGWDVECVPVNAEGRVHADEVAARLRDDTALVAVMAANNEIGTLQPVREIGAVCRARGVAFHCDAVQMPGRAALELDRWQADTVAFSGHKAGGPSGSGVLWVRPGVSVTAQVVGGAQENQRRGGTENTAAIAGLATALEWAAAWGADEWRRQEALRERLWAGLVLALPDVRRHTPHDGALCNTLSVGVTGVDGEELLMLCDLAGLAVSSGSACMVGSVTASHVLMACGVREEEARAVVRISFGPDFREADADEAVARLAGVVRQLRRTPGCPDRNGAVAREAVA